MPTAIVKDNIRLFDYNVPMAGYRDTIWRGEVSYYLTPERAVIGFRHIPLAIFRQWVDRGMITINKEVSNVNQES